MIVTINNVLPESDLAKIDERLPQLEFMDGRATASGIAAKVKNNRQAKPDDKGLEEIRRLVLGTLLKNEAFNSFALPLRMMPMIVNRYEPGMNYGDHIDRPVMQGPASVRTDLAMTLFLSAPDSYQGGELVVSSDLGAQRIKLNRGSLVLYPATTIHRVEPVTQGVRLAVVSWIQSMVREHERRVLLAELGSLRKWAGTAAGEGSPQVLQLQKIRANLLRMWAEV